MDLLSALDWRRAHFYHSEAPMVSLVAALLCLTLTTISLIKFGLFIRRRRQAIDRFRRVCNVPLVGEPGLFGGNLLQMIARDNNCQLIHHYHESLGHTYGLFYGPDPWIMTLDLELIQRVFITEGSIHINATRLRLPFVTEINESLAQLEGDKWRQIRRLMAPSFTPKSMRSDNVYEDISNVCDMFVSMLETIMSTAATTVRSSDNEFQLNGNGSTQLDVCYAFKKYSLEIIFRVAFGMERCARFELQTRDEIIDKLDEAAHMVSGRLVHLGIMFGSGQALRLLGKLSQLTPLGACIKRVHSIIATNLAKRRWQLLRRRETQQPQQQQQQRQELMKESPDECYDENDGGATSSAATTSTKRTTGQRQQQDCQNQDRKMIDSLIERFDLGKMDDETLKANLFFILLAGHETSANTLALMFWFLANNEPVQEKLRRSLIASGGDQAEYLNWVIFETLRLYPAVPAAIGRVLEHDIEHGGRRFPRGTTVIASIWSLHRWREYWGPDVDLFRPERFGESAVPAAAAAAAAQRVDARSSPPSTAAAGAAAATTGAASVAAAQLRFFAFAEGPRYCIGKHLAMAEIRAITARLLVKYRVSLCTNGDSSSCKESQQQQQQHRRPETISPNLIHFIIQQPIKLAFTKITNL